MNATSIIATLQQDQNQFNILGYLVFWSVRNVNVSCAQLTEQLEANGLDKKYAKGHNFRSAFIRALRNMEEKRIIRLVEDTDIGLVYQFTAENRIERAENIDPRLQYDPETIVSIDKTKYRANEDIRAATTGRADIVEKVIQYFHQEKESYQSADVTRMVQRIFTDNADIVCMRRQGGVYFVPSPFINLIERVSTLMASLGDACLDYLPLPDVQSSRATLKTAVTDEIDTAIDKLAEEIEIMGNADFITDKRVSHRIQQVQKLQQRIAQYTEIIDTSKMRTELEKMEAYLQKQTRALDLD
jgi:hypothetical protein